MKFCKSCGAQLDDAAQFCGNCGATQTVAPQPAPAQPAKPESNWDGGVLETIVNSIIASLIISITCGICTPWAICYMMKFVIGHAVVDGKRLTFDGNGASLFGNWIKWRVLSVITCGIYSFWVIPRLYQWIVKHIHTA